MSQNVLKRRWTPIALASGAVCAVLITASLTSAGFTQSASVTGSVSGQLDIAQGGTPADQHSTAATARALSITLPQPDSVITALPFVPDNEPTQPTAAAVMTVQTTAASDNAVVAFQLANLAATPNADQWDAVLFGIDRITGPIVPGELYPPHTSLLPAGKPLTAAQLTALTAPPTVTLPGGGGQESIMIRMWLSPSAPVAQFGGGVQLGITATGTSSGGDEIPLEVTLP